MANIGMRPSIQSPGIGAALTQPQLPVGQADQEKLGLWQAFRQKIASDPNLKMALLTAGANMLRTPDFGKSGFDVFADAAGAGIGTLDTLRQREQAQVAEAGDREFEQGATTRRLEQGDKRNEIAETTAATSAERAAEASRQGARRNELLKEQLDLARQQQAQGGELTGGERQVNSAVEALVKSGRFPNTEEGRAEALLLAQGLSGAISPEDQLRVAMGYVEKLRQENIFREQPLSDDDLFKQAFQDVDAMSGYFKSGAARDDSVATEEDPYVGQAINHSTQGTGTIEKVGDGRYVVKFPQGTTATLSSEQILRMLNANATATTE